MKFNFGGLYIAIALLVSSVAAWPVFSQEADVKTSSYFFNGEEKPAKKWRIDAGFGAEDFSYLNNLAPNADFQIIYQKPKKFFATGGLTFKNKLGEKSLSYNVGGGYFVHPKILLSDQISFSPTTDYFQKFGNSFEILGVLPKGFTPYFRYGFNLYNGGKTHAFTPGTSLYIGDRLSFDLNYTAIVSSIDAQSSQLDHALSAKITLIPAPDFFKTYLYYVFSRETFDTGLGGISHFHANVFGGGLEWFMAQNVGLRFDTEYERRNDDRTIHRYRLGMFYRF